MLLKDYKNLESILANNDSFEINVVELAEKISGGYASNFTSNLTIVLEFDFDISIC